MQDTRTNLHISLISFSSPKGKKNEWLLLLSGGEGGVRFSNYKHFSLRRSSQDNKYRQAIVSGTFAMVHKMYFYST